jgi:hypothetical protein
MIRVSINQVCRAAILTCILWAPAAMAADTPAPIHVGSEPTGEEVEAIQVPAIPVTEAELPAGSELTPREVVPVDPNDKGSVYTEGAGETLVGPPTALEAAKMAMARAAIEASRIAGTLFVPAAEITPDDAGSQSEAMKLQRLATNPPAPVVADPAAGSGVVTPPVQEVGPAGLTPQELEKLGKERK